jgi:predicted deacylase
MNPIGFEMGTRTISVTREDLNRAFPGNTSGSLAERIARKIFDIITDTRPALVIDIHNDWKKSIPYVIIDPNPGTEMSAAYGRVQHFAKSSGFIVIKEPAGTGDAIDWKHTLSGSLLNRGIPALTVELGEAYIVNEKFVKYGTESIWTILSVLGMTEPNDMPFKYPAPEKVSGKVLQYTHHPVSSTSGIIRFMAQPGDIVEKGQIIARIYNTFGKLLERILAPATGIVLGYSDSSVAFPGSPVMAFGTL